MADTTALSKNGQLYDIPNDRVNDALSKGFEHTVHLQKGNDSYDIPESMKESALSKGFKMPEPAKPTEAKMPESKDGIFKSIGKEVVGLGETALSGATGFAANIAGDIGGMVHKDVGLASDEKSSKSAEQIREETQEKFTYVPRTAIGKRDAKVMGEVLGWIPGNMQGIQQSILENVGVNKDTAKFASNVATDIETILLPKIAGFAAGKMGGALKTAGESKAPSVFIKEAKTAIDEQHAAGKIDKATADVLHQSFKELEGLNFRELTDKLKKVHDVAPEISDKIHEMISKKMKDLPAKVVVPTIVDTFNDMKSPTGILTGILTASGTLSPTGALAALSVTIAKNAAKYISDSNMIKKVENLAKTNTPEGARRGIAEMKAKMNQGVVNKAKTATKKVAEVTPLSIQGLNNLYKEDN